MDFLSTCRFQSGATDWIGAPLRIGAPNKRPPRRLLPREPHCRRREAARLLVSSPGTGRRPETRSGVHLLMPRARRELCVTPCIIGDSRRRYRICRPLPERRTRRRPVGQGRRTRKRSIRARRDERGGKEVEIVVKEMEICCLARLLYTRQT